MQRWPSGFLCLAMQDSASLVTKAMPEKCQNCTGHGRSAWVAGAAAAVAGWDVGLCQAAVTYSVGVLTSVPG